MKKLVKYLIDFVKEDFNVWLYLWTFLLMAAGIWVNYYSDFEWTEGKSRLTVWQMMLQYAVPYFGVAIPAAFLGKRNFEGNYLFKWQFWVKSIVFLFLMAGPQSNILDRVVLDWMAESSIYERHLVVKMLFYVKQLGMALLVLWVLKQAFDKKLRNFYGLTFRGADLKPYFIVLSIVLPLIIAASFQDDFLKAYPRFKPWLFEDFFGAPPVVSGTAFEVIYGSGFIAVEVIFRGAMVIGMASLMGRRSVLAMAAAYCFFHFGKPMGEAASSFFGGYILGVFSYYTYSVFGGIIVHLGVAMAMELTAYAQHLFRGIDK